MDSTIEQVKAQGGVTSDNDRIAVYTGIHIGRTPAPDKALSQMDSVFKVTER